MKDIKMICEAIEKTRKELKNCNPNNFIEINALLERLNNLYTLINFNKIAEIIQNKEFKKVG